MTTEQQQEEARVFSDEVLGKENVSAWYAWLHAEFKRKRAKEQWYRDNSSRHED